MSSEPIRVTHDGAVRTLAIARAETHNRLDAEVVSGLRAGLADAAHDTLVRVVVLTGDGDRVFSAGGDLGAMAGSGGALEAHRARADYAHLLADLRGLPKPVLARVNGHALGGGLGLVLACDVAVAGAGAELGTPEIAVGLWPHVISPLVLAHLGPKRTLDLMLTGRRVPAAEALALGLLTEVADDLDDAVARWTERLARLSPQAVALGKESLSAVARSDEHAGYLVGMLGLHLQSEDVREGVTAFLERREPRWPGV